MFRVQDDERHLEPDPKLLLRAAELGRLLLTCDQDFVRIGRQWQKDRRPFPGIAWITSDDADPRTVAECVLMLLGCGLPEVACRKRLKMESTSFRSDA